ncbi:MAG: hypothetical protein IRY92_09725 [Dactylosporangium sp.]|nr:hypothetical protein [Dactylosporangium sp.]
MYGLTDQELARIGRITVSASGLEAALSILSTRILSIPFFDILGKTGEPLRAARRALEEMDYADRLVIEPCVNVAEQLLQERHKVVHALSGFQPHDSGPSSRVRTALASTPTR